MTEAFDQKYGKIIDEMKQYLLADNLRMINFTYTDGWRFKLNILNIEYQKALRLKENKQ